MSLGKISTHLPLSLKTHTKQSTCPAFLIALGKSSDVGRQTAVHGTPGDILCLIEGFSRLGSKLPVRHRAGAPEEDVRDVNTKLACGMTYWLTI